MTDHAIALELIRYLEGVRADFASVYPASTHVRDTLNIWRLNAADPKNPRRKAYAEAVRKCSKS